jgi:hypothetical protein
MIWMLFRFCLSFIATYSLKYDVFIGKILSHPALMSKEKAEQHNIARLCETDSLSATGA